MSNSPYATEDDRFQDAANLSEQCFKEAFEEAAFRCTSRLVACDVEAEPETHNKTAFRATLTWEYTADTARAESMVVEMLSELTLIMSRAGREAEAVRS